MVTALLIMSLKWSNARELVHKRMPIYGLTTTFEASTNVSFDTDLFIFVTAIHLLVLS